jgi:predicted DCC family thiol-disulfide oxidoreductase YuxK
LNEAKVLGSSKNNDVLLIDGHCGMCSRLGNFLAKRISEKTPLDIIAQEEDAGATIISNLSSDIQNINSVILIRNDNTYYYSSAGIRCLLYMKWWWKMMYPFAWLTPLPIRDLIYKIIAKNRHRLSKN